MAEIAPRPVTVIPADILPSIAESWTDIPSMIPCMKAPLKESPAPVVSITLLSVIGSICIRMSPELIKAPSSPKVTTVVVTPIDSTSFIATWGSVVLKRGTQSAGELGRNMST